MDVLNGQIFDTFTNSSIIGSVDVTTCNNVYQKNTTDGQRTESYSWDSTSFYQNITFTTCGSAFDTTLRLYHWSVDNKWMDIAYADDEGNCGQQAELMLSNLVSGYYVLELSAFNGLYFGFYSLGIENCILGTAPQTTTPPTTAFPTTAPVDTNAPTTSGSTTAASTSSENANDSALGDESDSGVSLDLLVQICIGLAVYALIPCIFYCVRNTCCTDETDGDTSATNDIDSSEDDTSKPNILKSYVISMIDIFDSSTDIISGYNFFFIKGCGILACQSDTLSSFDAYGYIFIACGSIGAIITILKNILLYYQIKNVNNTDSTISMKMKILGGRLEAGKILLCDIPIAACFIVLLMINKYDLSFTSKISLTITFMDLLILTLFYCKEWQNTSRERMLKNMNQQIDENGQVYSANYDASSVMRAQMCNSSYCMYFCLIMIVFILGLELAFAWGGIIEALSPKMLTINEQCYGEDGTFGSYEQDGYSIGVEWWSWNLELDIGEKPGLYGGTDPCVESSLDYGKCLTVDPSQYRFSNCSNIGTSPIEICVDRCTLDN